MNEKRYQVVHRITTSLFEFPTVLVQLIVSYAVLPLIELDLFEDRNLKWIHHSKLTWRQDHGVQYYNNTPVQCSELSHNEVLKIVALQQHAGQLRMVTAFGRFLGVVYRYLDENKPPIGTTDPNNRADIMVLGVAFEVPKRYMSCCQLLRLPHEPQAPIRVLLEVGAALQIYYDFGFVHGGLSSHSIFFRDIQTYSEVGLIHSDILNQLPTRTRCDQRSLCHEYDMPFTPQTDLSAFANLWFQFLTGSPGAFGYPRDVHQWQDWALTNDPGAVEIDDTTGSIRSSGRDQVEYTPALCALGFVDPPPDEYKPTFLEEPPVSLSPFVDCEPRAVKMLEAQIPYWMIVLLDASFEIDPSRRPTLLQFMSLLRKAKDHCPNLISTIEPACKCYWLDRGPILVHCSHF